MFQRSNLYDLNNQFLPDLLMHHFVFIGLHYEFQLYHNCLVDLCFDMDIHFNPMRRGLNVQWPSALETSHLKHHLLDLHMKTAGNRSSSCHLFLCHLILGWDILLRLCSLQLLHLLRNTMVHQVQIAIYLMLELPNSFLLLLMRCHSQR